MRQVAYTKNELAHNRGRRISVRENVVDSDSETCVVKNFVYLISRVDVCPEELPVPEIRMIKKIDTQDQRERFIFRVKGVIYIKKNRFIFQVRYSHGLNVHIMWKTHVLSPDKPAALA